MDPATVGAIQVQLQAVLASPQFANSERLARFLQFVTDKTLAGEKDEIKESVIAVEVYGRRGDYDPKIDSIVRVEAHRLRTKLRDYYASEGHGASVLIELPRGQYVPAFTVPDRAQPTAAAEQKVEQLPPAQTAPAPSAIPTSHTWRRKFLALLIPGILLGVGVALYRGRRPAPPRPAPGPLSIAILPFVNFSVDPTDEKLADALTEEITNVLVNAGEFQVAGRTSAYQFKSKPDSIPSIGAQLHVGNILEGSIRREGQRVRITAQLVGASDGFHLWSVGSPGTELEFAL